MELKANQIERANSVTKDDIMKLIKSFQGVDKTVYDHVMENNLLSEPAMDVSLREIYVTGESFKNIIIRNGFLKQNQLTDIILSIRPEELMNDEVIDPSVPYEVLENNKAMICAITEENVYISTLRNKELLLFEIEEYFPSRNIKFVPANVSKIGKYLNKVKRLKNNSSNFLETTIRKAIREGASDIHIEPEAKGYSINIRVMGLMRNIHFGDVDEFNKLIAVLKIQAGADLAQKKLDQDGSYTIDFNGTSIDLRVVTIPASHGREKAVIRILDPNSVQTNLQTLGITNVEEWRKGIHMKNGLCLICGETGSGKTTTLNSSVREMDRFTKTIYTIEDPVEYQINNVAQINIAKSTGMTFAKALKACMRGDPDVVIVGEVRDEETARNMIKAAETGHLVIATLHTGQVLGAVNRLRDIGVDKKELRDILRAVLVQSLVRISCNHCGGKGCVKCNNLGYTGRTVVSECVYFKNSDEVNRILKDEPDKWWATKEEDAYLKYKNGVTDKKEFIRVFGEAAKDILVKNGESIEIEGE